MSGPGGVSNPSNINVGRTNYEYTLDSADNAKKVSSGTAQEDTVGYSQAGDFDIFSGKSSIGFIDSPKVSNFDVMSLIKELELDSDDSNQGVQEESIKSGKASLENNTEKNIDSLESLQEGHQENKNCGAAMVIVGTVLGVLLAPLTAGTSLLIAAPLIGVGADKVAKGKEGLEAVKTEAGNIVENRFGMDKEIVEEWMDEYKKEFEHASKLGGDVNSKAKLQASLDELYVDLEILSEDEYNLLAEMVENKVSPKAIKLGLAMHVAGN